MVDIGRRDFLKMPMAQQVMLGFGSSGVVACNQPFVLDFSFPGLCSNITSGPIYTFTQDVRFPLYVGAGLGPISGTLLVNNGSSVTITQNTVSGSEVVEFVMSTNAQVTTPNGTAAWGIYANTLIDGIGLQLQTVGATQGVPYTATMAFPTFFTNPNLGGGFVYYGMAPASPPAWVGATWLSGHYYIDGFLNEFVVFYAGESLYLRPLTADWGIPTFFEDLSIQLVGEVHCAGNPFSATIDIPGLLSARANDTSIIYTFTDNVKVPISANVLTGITCTIDTPESTDFAWYTIFNQSDLIGNDCLLIGVAVGETVVSDPYRLINTPSGTFNSSRISGGYYHFIVGDQLSFNNQTAIHSAPNTDAAGAHLTITGFYE
jgi:hypothetical protein